MKKIIPKLNERDKLFRRLAVELCNHNRYVSRVGWMNVKAVPLINNVTFDGVPINHYIVPQVKDADVVAAFDAIIEYVDDPYTRVDVAANAECYIDSSAWVFATNGRTCPEMVMRLLFVMSTVEGWALTYDAKGAMLRRDGVSVGFRDGVVFSPTKRINGTKIAVVDPQAYYTQPRKEAVRSRAFVSLYREAYRLGTGLTNVLIAIATLDPGYNWSALAGSAELARMPSEAAMGAIEVEVYGAPDPARYLLRKLVPQYMRLQDYRKYIGSPYANPRKWSIEARSRLFNRVAHFFQNVITGE